MTTQLEQAARQTLEALESVYGKGKRCEAAITALRAALSVSSIQCEETSHALEQPSNVKQVIELYDSPEQPAQDEPVAMVTGTYGGRFTVKPTNPATVLPLNMALYTRPQARDVERSSTERKETFLQPLTDEQMKGIWYAMQNIMGWYSFEEIARAIEAAHGIKELK